MAPSPYILWGVVATAYTVFRYSYFFLRPPTSLSLATTPYPTCLFLCAVFCSFFFPAIPYKPIFHNLTYSYPTVPKWLLFLINVRSVFQCLCRFPFPSY